MKDLNRYNIKYVLLNKELIIQHTLKEIIGKTSHEDSNP